MPNIRSGSVLDSMLVGAPSRLGVIVGTTTSKNNHDTATPFVNTGDALIGKVLVLQPDVACRIKVGTANTQTATSTDYLIEANQPFPLRMPVGNGFLAARAEAGTVNLQVYELV